MNPPRKRITYVIRSPPALPPRLQFPPTGVSRIGSVAPLLIESQDQMPAAGHGSHPCSKIPRHRLGVASLAVDTSTVLAGRSTPEGILYSGGRDGLVISWDLGWPTRIKAMPEETNDRYERWERLTGWEDEVDEDIDCSNQRDGDVLGEVSVAIPRAKPGGGRDVWELDAESFNSVKARSQFRQCAQVHTDWVNDLLLCNQNQTAVSASSDGTVKAWNPHDVDSNPTTIGTHSDYVRCLAYCREQNWVASGSFDRTIKIWDLGYQSSDPLVTLNPPDLTAPKSSVYALAVDPFGRTIASGSPERVIRLWDPRTGRRTAKLVGHTDNIRDILISEDSRYLLTGSADASIKLWSLASQRCLHTFTHHSESIWALHSSHPSLEIFYSGDRSGLVCRVDVEDCSDISEGECIVLCQDSTDPNRPSEGIKKIVAVDDSLLWVASGISSITRWHLPSKRIQRAIPQSLGRDAERIKPEHVLPRRYYPMGYDLLSEANTRISSGYEMRCASSSFNPLPSETYNREVTDKIRGIPVNSLVKLVSPDDPFAPYSASRLNDPDVATLYSAASIMSVPFSNHIQSGSVNYPQSRETFIQTSRTDETMIAMTASRAAYEDRDLAADAIPLCASPDEIIPGDNGLVRSLILNDRIHALTVDTSGEVAVWDIVRATCLGRYLPQDVNALGQYSDGSAGSSNEKERSPRELLEAVRERIEGEAAISPWCSADTKTGLLAIHMNERMFEAEIYADEVGFAHNPLFNSDSKLNIGKWVLQNLFAVFIQEEERLHVEGGLPDPDDILSPSFNRKSSSNEMENSIAHRRTVSSPEWTRARASSIASSIVVCSANMTPAIPPATIQTARRSPLFIPLIPLRAHPDSPSVQQSIVNAPEIVSQVSHSQRTLSGAIVDSGSPTIVPLVGQPKENDYFSQRSHSVTSPSVFPRSGTLAVAVPEDASVWSKADTQAPGGLMGRLKSFGKMTKRPASEWANLGVPEAPAPLNDSTCATEDPTPGGQSWLQILLSSPLSPPPSNETPRYTFPPDTEIIIEEEADENYTVVYRGEVSEMSNCVPHLERAIPMWLLEYLLLNKIPNQPTVTKVNFVLLPWNKNTNVEPLPELLNTAQSKLTASRFLRVRKIVAHVHEKLERIIGSTSDPDSIHMTVEGQTRSSATSLLKPEELFEIVCGDVLLPLDITLAAVRQYVWRQPFAELVLYYRRKSSRL